MVSSFLMVRTRKRNTFSYMHQDAREEETDAH